MSVSLKDRAYSHIRTKLLSGEYSPGSQLSHRMLAKEIGVSFTPVREALSQLASEGLVESKPRMGTFVAKCSREELVELYDLREALEGHAAETAAGRLSDADLEEMQRCNDAQRQVIEELEASGGGRWTADLADRFATADAALHLVLLRAAGNRRTLHLIGELRVMTHIFGHRNRTPRLESMKDAHETHQRIIEALRVGDPGESRAAMVASIRRGCSQALEQYDRVRIEEAAGQMASVNYPADLRQRIAKMEEELPVSTGMQDGVAEE